MATLRRIEITPKTMLTAALIIGACYLLSNLLPVVLVVIAALLLVGTLNPIVRRLEALGLKRKLGIALVFLVALLASVGIAALTLPPLGAQVRNLLDREPEIRNRLADSLSDSRVTAPLANSLRNVRYDAIAQSSLSAAFAISTRAIEIVAYLVSAIFLSLYIMVDRDRLRGGLFALVPRRYHIRLSRVLLNLETIVGGYIRGQLFTSALLGVFSFVLLLLCRVESALALAVFAAVADVLPYIGVLFVVVPAALAASARGLPTVLIVVGALVAYLELESRVIVPKVYGRALRLPSSVVMLSLLVGATLMGMVGALLALPAAAAIRMLIEELRVTLPGEEIDDKALRERDERAEREYETRANGVPAREAAAIATEISDERRNEEGGAERDASTPVTGGQR